MSFVPTRDAFDHIGLITDQPQPDETWVEANRLWITNPRKHPFHIEYPRYAPDSPVPLLLRTKPHVAYRTTGMEHALAGHKTSLGLSPIMIDQIYRILSALNGDGLTLFIVEQNISRIWELANRIYVLRKGGVVLSGATEDFSGPEEIESAYFDHT